MKRSIETPETSINKRPRVNETTEMNKSTVESESDSESGSESGSGSEESSSGSEEEDDDDGYEKIKMTQSQYEDYINKINGGYNGLSTNLKAQRSKVARDGNISAVTLNLLKANSLYENSKLLGDTHYQNEITNLDSKLIREIGEQLSMGVNNIDLGGLDNELDFNDFMQKFAKYTKRTQEEDQEQAVYLFNGDENDIDLLEDFHYSFNWGKISALYMKHSTKVPTIDFLLGPLDVEFKKRKQSRREADYLKSGSALKPSLVQLDELTTNSEKDTYQSAIQCYKILQQKNDSEAINMFRFIINPHSFSQSIENLFYMSFLINHDKLMLFKNDNDEGIPYVKIPTPNERYPKYISASGKSDTKSHLIFKLEYDTWLKLIEKYEIRDLYLGNRET